MSRGRGNIYLILILISISLPAIGQKNHYFAPREGRFSVNFPCGYTVSADSVEEATTYKAECYHDDEYFLASYTPLPAIVPETSEMEGLSLEFFKEAVKATEISKKEWDIREHAGLAAYLIMTEESARIDYRVVIVDDILYQLVYIAKDDLFREEKATKFMNSFILFEP